MANCSDCGKKIGIFNKSDVAGTCIECVRQDYLSEKEKNRKAQASIENAQASAEQEASIRHEAAISKVLLTTESNPDLNIAQRIEIVTAECAFGMNIFKDLFAGVRDIVGGRSEAVQKTLRDSRKTALYELKKEAHAVGANAVVGVDLDYVELSASGSMVLLVASGTAVVIE